MTEEPGVLWSKGSQTVRHDLATEQQQQQQCFAGYKLNLDLVTCEAKELISIPFLIYLICIFCRIEENYAKEIFNWLKE